MAVGAIPIANAVSDAAYRRGIDLRSFFVRKTAKDHGTQRTVEGEIRPGESVVIVEDVVTTGQSTLAAMKDARDYGLTILQVAAVIDREEADGRKQIEDQGVPFLSLFTIQDFESLRQSG
jgi:orotate phosphoribosyltransferase